MFVIAGRQTVLGESSTSSLNRLRHTGPETPTIGKNFLCKQSCVCLRCVAHRTRNGGSCRLIVNHSQSRMATKIQKGNSKRSKPCYRIDWLTTLAAEDWFLDYSLKMVWFAPDVALMEKDRNQGYNMQSAMEKKGTTRRHLCGFIVRKRDDSEIFPTAPLAFKSIPPPPPPPQFVDENHETTIASIFSFQS